jgi:uncharacterized protein (DUF362 family)
MLKGTGKAHRVFVAHAAEYAAAMQAAVAWLGVERKVRQANGIFLKPNFTFPQFRPGVTTTKEVLRAALQVFSELNANVIVGESDGGYGTFDAESAFAAFDLYSMAKECGCQVLNLAKSECVVRTLQTNRGPVSLRLPKFLIEDNFLTVTIPVPKVHCLTGVSLSYKNQWGCIPDPMRLRFHYFFDEIIGPINRLLNVGMTIIDGTYGLTKNGPVLDGEVVKPNWLIISSHLGAADRVASRLMGLTLEGYSHYRKIHIENPIPSLREIEVSTDLSPFLNEAKKFYLKRNLWNILAKATWYSRGLCHLVYESRVSRILHRIMYSFRHRPKEFRVYDPRTAKPGRQ